MVRATRIPALLGLVGCVACGSDTVSDTAPGASSDSPAPAVHDTSPSASRDDAFGRTVGDRMGRITGMAPEAADGTPSVVVLRPHEPVDIPVPTEPAEMDQFGREFFPRLLLVRQGQPVVFLNSEDDIHTVHVQDMDGNSLFNVAMPIRGGRHDHTFAALGEYEVSCDAHSEMAATILVVDTPFATVANRDGAFSFEQVPAGRYDLILRRGGQHHEEIVEVGSGDNTLTVSFP